MLEKYDVPVMYIPIVKTKAELEQVLERDINTVGAELIIESENSDFHNKELISTN